MKADAPGIQGQHHCRRVMAPTCHENGQGIALLLLLLLPLEATPELEVARVVPVVHEMVFEIAPVRSWAAV